MQKILRVTGVIVIAFLLISAIFISMNSKPSNSEIVWDEKTTIGNPEAKNYFIIYSDLVCPYCIAFENALVEHEEEFKQYLADNDILLEIRTSDFLYRYGESRPKSSHYSAVATYCAKNEGKFWDYYDHAVASVWKDFFKENGKSGFSKLSARGQDYWVNLGLDVGLGDEFKDCVKNESPASEIQQNAEKTSKLAGGMPYFKFNRFTDSGFDLSWGWDEVKQYFEAGLNSVK